MKGITMFFPRSTMNWLIRTARVQFLAGVAMVGLLMLPAWAAAEDEFAPSDLPGEEPALPAVEPAQPIDESVPAAVVEAQLDKIIKSVVEAAHTLARTAAPDAGNGPVDEDSEAVTPEPAAQADVQPSDVTTQEAEIDSIAAQIEQEKILSAQRIAELEARMSEAREQLTAITKTDGEGFIRAWLVLGPIPVDAKVSNHDEESNKEFLDRPYVASQATPTEGDNATVDEVELAWKAVHSNDYFVDLAKVAVDQELDAEHAAYLGVAYVTSEEEVANVKLSIGSDDDSVWRLNGKEVIRSYNGRGIDKDQDSADELTLKKGVNVLTFTVLNGEGPTAAAARFVDEDGNPVKGLKVSLTPPTQQTAQTDVKPDAGDDQNLEE